VSIAVWTLATATVVAGFATDSILTVLAGLIAWMAAMGAINVIGGGLNAMREEELDERQARHRERTLALAHRAMSVILLVVFVASAALTQEVADDTFTATLAGLALLHIATPSLILAARARLPEPADSESADLDG